MSVLEIITYVPKFTAVEANRMAIQAMLIKAGKTAEPSYDCGPDGADGTLGENTGKAIIAFRADHGLSGAPVIDHDLLRALKLEDQVSNDPAPTSAVVETQNPLLSTKNWALVVSVLSFLLPLVGVHLPMGWSDVVYNFVGSAFAVYAIIRQTFFTKTISTFVAKRL